MGSLENRAKSINISHASTTMDVRTMKCSTLEADAKRADLYVDCFGEREKRRRSVLEYVVMNGLLKK